MGETPATGCAMGSVQGVAVHPTTGNLYIVETTSGKVRFVNVTTGMQKTIAGVGSSGFYGDGGAATSASLNYPSRVAVHPTTGNVYIADTNNHRIRKITILTGIITTFAGTGTAGYNSDGIQATSAQLNNPYGMVVDTTTGDVYFADSDNHRIRKIAGSTGIITTVAGNGTQGFSGDGGAATRAQLNTPYDVFLHTVTGDLYIADRLNSRIRKVTASTGIITTVAGTGTSGYNGDNIQATSAQLKLPAGVFVHPTTADMYIADTVNFRIRKVVQYLNSNPCYPTPVPCNGGSGSRVCMVGCTAEQTQAGFAACTPP